MVLNKTADERLQFPSAAALGNFEELPTSSKESRNQVTSTSRTRTDKQSIYVAKRLSQRILEGHLHSHCYTVLARR